METNVFGPLDESGQVLLGGDGTTYKLATTFNVDCEDVPIPKVLDRFSKRGLVSFLAVFLVPSRRSAIVLMTKTQSLQLAKLTRGCGGLGFSFNGLGLQGH